MNNKLVDISIELKKDQMHAQSQVESKKLSSLSDLAVAISETAFHMTKFDIGCFPKIKEVEDAMPMPCRMLMKHMESCRPSIPPCTRSGIALQLSWKISILS